MRYGTREDHENFRPSPANHTAVIEYAIASIHYDLMDTNDLLRELLKTVNAIEENR